MTPYYNTTVLREKYLELARSEESVIRFFFTRKSITEVNKFLTDYWNEVHQFAFDNLKQEISIALNEGADFTPQLVYDTIKRLEEEFEFGSTIHIAPEPENYLKMFAKNQFLWIGANQLHLDEITLNEKLGDWAND